jgi:hypothetical protein
VAPEWLDLYIVGHYQLEVANDVFNGVGTSRLVILPGRTWSAAWCRAIWSPGTVAVLGEWSTGPMLHYSYTVVVCLHIL